VQLHVLRCWVVLVWNEPDDVYPVRMWYVQHQHRAHHAVHCQVQRRILLEQWSERLQFMPRWPILHDERDVHVFVLRMRHLQHFNTKDDTVHKQMRNWTVLQCRRILVCVLFRWDVRKREWILCVYNMRSWEVSIVHWSSIVHELRVRHV
jgi:hypothetical protein